MAQRDDDKLRDEGQQRMKALLDGGGPHVVLRATLMPDNQPVFSGYRPQLWIGQTNEAGERVYCDEHCAAQRLCLGELESSNYAASHFGEPTLDHRRIVERQRSDCRPRVRPMHARIRHTGAAAHSSTAALTSLMPAAPTQTHRHQQEKHQPPHTHWTTEGPQRFTSLAPILRLTLADIRPRPTYLGISPECLPEAGDEHS
jgi:hypothetical protein